MQVVGAPCATPQKWLAIPFTRNSGAQFVLCGSLWRKVRTALLTVAALIACGCASKPQLAAPTLTLAASSRAVEASVTVFPVNSLPRKEDLIELADTITSTTSPIEENRQTETIWTRIRRGYGIPDIDGTKVSEATLWYASRPDYLRRMTMRAQKYLFHVVEELERRKMPLELALLPFVESAFNPAAVSSARAAGLWQFIPSTGKDFSLRQNVFLDDRRDVLASTRAALDYLQKLHTMFGDWHLALAAYNWGEGNVSSAIRRNQRVGLSTNYADLHMPSETRSYLPKLQAVKNIVSVPEQFGFQLPVIGNHPYFRLATISRDMDTAVAARFARISHDEFLSLNPAAIHPVIFAAAMPKILLPWKNADLFQLSLAGHQGRPLASWTAWVVPATMRPSAAAKKFGMTEADLCRVNRIPSGKSVRRGSTLLVRRKPNVLADVSGPVAENAALVLEREQKSPQHNVKRTIKPTSKTSTRQSARRGTRIKV